MIHNFDAQKLATDSHRQSRGVTVSWGLTYGTLGMLPFRSVRGLEPNLDKEMPGVAWASQILHAAIPRPYAGKIRYSKYT